MEYLKWNTQSGISKTRCALDGSTPTHFITVPGDSEAFIVV